MRNARKVELSKRKFKGLVSEHMVGEFMPQRTLGQTYLLKKANPFWIVRLSWFCSPGTQILMELRLQRNIYNSYNTSSTMNYVKKTKEIVEKNWTQQCRMRTIYIYN